MLMKVLELSRIWKCGNVTFRIEPVKGSCLFRIFLNAQLRSITQAITPTYLAYYLAAIQPPCFLYTATTALPEPACLTTIPLAHQRPWHMRSIPYFLFLKVATLMTELLWTFLWTHKVTLRHHKI